MDDRQNPSQDPDVPFENVDNLSMPQILTPYDQIFYSDALGLEASMQFPAQLKF